MYHQKVQSKAPLSERGNSQHCSIATAHFALYEGPAEQEYQRATTCSILSDIYVLGASNIHKIHGDALFIPRGAFHMSNIFTFQEIRVSHAC